MTLADLAVFGFAEPLLRRVRLSTPKDLTLVLLCRRLRYA